MSEKTKGVALCETLMSAEQDEKSRKTLGRQVAEGMLEKRRDLLMRLTTAIIEGNDEGAALARGTLRELDDLAGAVVCHPALAAEILIGLLDKMRTGGDRGLR